MLSSATGSVPAALRAGMTTEIFGASAIRGSQAARFVMAAVRVFVQQHSGRAAALASAKPPAQPGSAAPVGALADRCVCSATAPNTARGARALPLRHLARSPGPASLVSRTLLLKDPQSRESRCERFNSTLGHL